jgi:hypothetical protein
MKLYIKITVKLFVFAFLCSFPLKAAEKLTKKQVENYLSKITNKKEFGDDPEYYEFYQLRSICESLRNTEEPDLVGDVLLKEVMSRNASVKKPTDWASLAIYLRRGTVGLLMDCYMDIKGNDGFETLYKELLKKDDHLKMAVLLQLVIKHSKEIDYVKIDHVNIISKNMPPKPSLKMKKVIEEHLEKIATGNTAEILE